MSEVDRFTRQGVGASDRAGFWVHAGDFNQKMSQAKDREAYLQDQIDKWTALSGEHFKRAEILKLERDALQQRLTAADERWDELVSAVRSINRSPHYMVKAIDDDQPQYRQRKEWIDWVLGLCDAAPTSSERSNKDYAIEHAEYMAKSADDVLAKFQAYGLALLAVDEGGDDGEGELFENIDSARGDLQEALVDLRGMVYEFRKRAAKSR